MTRCLIGAGLCLLAAVSPAADPQAKVERLTCRVLGLFAPEREAELRSAFAGMPGVTLLGASYADAEVSLEFVPAKAGLGAKPHEWVEGLNNKLRSATHNTLGLKAKGAVPRERLREEVIGVAGHDCSGCNLAIYELVAKIDGVERATVSLGGGRVVTLLDPAKADRAAVEEALRKRGVKVADTLGCRGSDKDGVSLSEVPMSRRPWHRRSWVPIAAYLVAFLLPAVWLDPKGGGALWGWAAFYVCLLSIFDGEFWLGVLWLANPLFWAGLIAWRARSR